jgi:DNA-directed RNA polymerase
MNQLELETKVMANGIAQRLNEMAERELKGRGGDGPYANRIYREFVLPIAAEIKQLILTPGKGRKFALALAPIGALEVAYIAVRCCLSNLLHYGTSNNRGLAYQLGIGLYTEVALQQVGDASPELIWLLTRDMDRRGSVDETARAKVLLRAARNGGIHFEKWDKVKVEGVGNLLYWLMLQAGLIAEGQSIYRNGRAVYREVQLSDPVLDSLVSIREFVAEANPQSCPTIEPPKPWTALNEGGFHGAMRRICPFAVQTTPAARPLVRSAPMETFYAAINAVQATPYRINRRVLEVASSFVQGGRAVGEYLGDVAGDKPVRESWMEVEKEDWTPQQKEQFATWKAQTRDWYTRKKLQRDSTSRVYVAIRQARQFSAVERLYFVHFADTRGRLYAISSGVSPQGSDLQRALIEFADGKRLDTPDAVTWFLRTGANRFGFDKASTDEQLAWVEANRPAILGSASDPFGCKFWRDADDPFKFLAWCFEYRQWLHAPDTFLSHLPVGMDGTCNGLQHFSAMLRDPIGAKATNLLPSDRPQDIYMEVARATLERIKRAPVDPHGYRAGWMKLGVERKVMKRPVMTTPYGVTRRTCVMYVAQDYLGPMPNCPWPHRRHIDAANWLMDHGWPAIADVVVAARAAMGWLSKAASKAVGSSTDVVLAWDTPSGFKAHQSYATIDTVRIETILYGHRQIRVGIESDKPDMARHRAGLPPNFVHSMDAAHLHLTTSRAAREGVTALSMVHDDYACHAADAPLLARILREEFVSMYSQHDPLRDFAKLHPLAGDPPKPGDMDIREVLQSVYFFA